jgi:hypothetical protein
VRASRSWNFRIYPDPKSRLYVRVIVVESRKDFTTLVVGRHLTGADATLGFCQASNILVGQKGRLHRDPEVATVAFYRRAMGEGMVAHEFLHATAAWFRRRRWSTEAIGQARKGTIPRDHPEEVACILLGRMVALFTQRAIRLGIYT